MLMPSLSGCLGSWLSWCTPICCRGMLCSPLVFPTCSVTGRAGPSSLLPLSATTSTRCCRGLAALQCSPPSRIRHIFVDERRSLDAAPGPSNVGAATVMGNSVGQWDRSYDLGMRSRETQAAVDAMPQWREAMLERSRGPVLQA